MESDLLAALRAKDAASVRFVTSWLFVGDERVCGARTLDLRNAEARPDCDCGDYPSCACPRELLTAFLARNAKTLRRVALPMRLYRLVPRSTWESLPARVRASARSHLVQSVCRLLKRKQRKARALIRASRNGGTELALVLSR